MTGRVEMLKDALKVLAAEPDEQVRWLDTQDVPVDVDELALDYDAIAAAADNMLREGEISKAQCECVKALHQYFDTFSGAANADLWDEAALRSAEQWRRVREMARECLGLLDETQPGT